MHGHMAQCLAPLAAKIVLLVASLACLLSPAASQKGMNTTVQEVPFFPNRTTINICTVEYTPFIHCAGLQPNEFSGYEIALFNEVRHSLGWMDAMLNWTCWNGTGPVDVDDVITSIESGNSFCDMVVAGNDATKERLDRGWTFSWPTFNGGKGIAVPVSGFGSNPWAFVNAFSWDVWFATDITCIGTGFLVWGLDLWARVGEDVDEADEWEKLKQNVYVTTGVPMGAQDAHCESFAGNIVLLMLCFIMMVVVTVYTANTAANITTYRLTSSINGLKDLPGKAVGTYELYVDDLGRRGIAASGYPWNNAADEARMMAALSDGSIQALVLTKAALLKLTNDICNITVLPDEFDLIDQAFVFPKGFSNWPLYDRINQQLMELKSSGVMEQLVGEYIDPPSSDCQLEYTTSTQITFAQLSGLWILFGAAVGVAILFAALHHWMMRDVRMHGWLVYLRQRKAKFNCKLHRAVALNPKWRAEQSGQMLQQLANRSGAQDSGSLSDSIEGKAADGRAGFSMEHKAAAVAVPMPPQLHEQGAHILAELQRLQASQLQLQGLVQQLHADVE